MDQQGTYGMMQKPPPVYKIKERKPKVYSSYAVDNPNCTVHSKNLKKQVRLTSSLIGFIGFPFANKSCSSTCCGKPGFTRNTQRL